MGREEDHQKRVESRDSRLRHKARYVKSQCQTRPHHCHWPGCAQQVPPALWGCKRHWYMLPKELRDAIWEAYQPGQEVRGTPSPEYVAVALRVQQWIRDNYNIQEEE